MSTSLAGQPLASRLGQFYQLTKPRVVSLIVFTAVIGMFLATPGMVPLQVARRRHARHRAGRGRRGRGELPGRAEDSTR